MNSESPNLIDGDQSGEDRDAKITDHSEEAKTASPPTATATDTQPWHKHPQACNTKRDWIDWMTLGLEGFGLFVVIVYTIATIKYVGITHHQWDAMRCSNAITESNHVNDQRSWIGFALPEAAQFREQQTTTGTQLTKEPLDILVPVSVVNTGKTPAFDVHGNLVITIIKKGDNLALGEYGPGHLNYALYGGMMSPGASMGLAQPIIKRGPNKGTTLSVLPSPALKERIERGLDFIVVHGRIDYLDFRQRPHFTTFCRYVTTPGLIDGDCIAYNKVDEDEAQSHPLAGCEPR